MVELGVRRHWPNEVIVCVCVCMTECIWSGGVKGMRYQGTWTLARKLTKSGACGGIEWLIKLVCVCVCVRTAVDGSHCCTGKRELA